MISMLSAVKDDITEYIKGGLDLTAKIERSLIVLGVLFVVAVIFDALFGAIFNTLVGFFSNHIIFVIIAVVLLYLFCSHSDDTNNA